MTHTAAGSETVDGSTGALDAPSTTAAEFEQRIRTQIHRSITIAHASTFVTGVISIVGSAHLRRHPRAWAALGVSAAQGVLARRSMARGDFETTYVAAAHAVAAALNQELMPTIPDGVSKGERRWVRDQAVWLSAMGGAGKSRRPGLWTLVAHAPLLARAAAGEAPAASHVGGQALWLAFLRTALTDALLRAPAVLSALDEHTEKARTHAEEQATRDALARSVTPLLDRMRLVRDAGSRLSAADRQTQCREMLSEASDVCDQAASTMGAELRDTELYESMLSKLQRRSDRTNTVSYWAVAAGSLTNLYFDSRRGDVARWRLLVSAGITSGMSWYSLRNPSRFLSGELHPGSTPALVAQGLAGGSSALVLRGAPGGCESFGNRELLTLTASGLGSHSRSVLVPWAISSAIGLRSLYQSVQPDEQVFLLAGTFGMEIGLPLALNHFLRGVMMTNEAAAASRERLVADARAAGTRRAMRWAQLAAHDYVKQTARYLLSHPEQAPEHVEEVLGDAIVQLEDALSSKFQQSPARTDVGTLISEIAEAYRRLSLDPVVHLELSGPLSPDVERAVLTAVNQGLANVLAHTVDPVPVVQVRTADGGAEIAISNNPDWPAPPVSSPDGTGFRLLDAALASVGGTRTLHTDERATVLRARIPAPC